MAYDREVWIPTGLSERASYIKIMIPAHKKRIQYMEAELLIRKEQLIILENAYNDLPYSYKINAKERAELKRKEKLS